jgi:mannose-6-phosphate isomerase-like protein (cupin superfamily)
VTSTFVIEPNAEKTVDNGIARLNVLVEPGRAPGFAVFVNNFPGFGGGPPAHHHNSYDEAFYVLNGEMEFHVDDVTERVAAGSMAFVPRGSTHAFRNPSAEPAQMLVITTPEAIDLIVRMPEGIGNPDKMRALFSEHDSQVDGPPLG